MERLSSADIEKANKLLWEACEGRLPGAGLEFYIRRDSDRRSQLSANLDDLLQAFHRSDSTDEVPMFYCEALHLFKLPPLSLDPIAEQVKLNSSVLKTLSSTIEELRFLHLVISNRHQPPVVAMLLQCPLESSLQLHPTLTHYHRMVNIKCTLSLHLAVS